jgi:pimeloyl-ACP methyl ester carboxylesterase
LSFGGALAFEVYRRHPGLPRSLILASAYAGWAGSLSPDVVEARREHTLRQADLPPEEFADVWLTTLVSKSAPAAVVAEVRAMLHEFHPNGIRPGTRAIADADLRDACMRIDVPTLLIYGDEDVRSPLAVAEDLHSRIPGSQLVVLPGVGHLVDVEAGDRFNAEIRAFLRAVG